MSYLKDPAMRLARRHVFIILFAVGLGGLLARLSHLSVGIPVEGDALLYFRYAFDVAQAGALPKDYTPFNNGWPIFLSVFFRFTDSASYLDYMLVQKLVGAALSVLTAAPVYVICRRFFPEKLALVGPAIFVFDPAVMRNSVMGLTEPLFVILTAMAIACFLSRQKRVVFLTFPLIAVSMMVRGEMTIMLAPFLALYVIRFRHSRKTAYEAPALILVAVLILIPMIDYRMEILGSDGMFVRVWDRVGGQIDKLGSVADGSGSVQSTGFDGIFYKLRDLVQFGDLLLMPLAFLVPYGLVHVFRAKTKHLSIVVLLASMFAITVNALSVTGSVPRYVFWMIPILCILCTISAKRLTDLFANKNLGLAVIMGLVVAFSAVALEDGRVNDEYQKDGHRIDRIISELVGSNGWNLYETYYIQSVTVLDLSTFPDLQNLYVQKGAHVSYCYYLYPPNCSAVDDHGDKIASYLKKFTDKKFTHMVIDNAEERKDHLLIHVFQHEDQYPYVEKIYDSRDDGFGYHVKVFEIDYEVFAEMYPD